MNRTEANWGTGANRRFLAAAGMAGLLALTGCGEKPEPIQVVTPKAEPTERPRPRKTAERRSASSGNRVQRAPAPAPAATPEPTPVTVMARDMNPSGAGVPDAEGGMVLTNNGALQIDNVKIPFTVGKVVVEMKGIPAREVWPEVDLNAFNRTTQKNYFPLSRTFVTTSSYHLYHLPQEERIPDPGTYFLSFRFYNNQDFPETKEDRNAYLRKIEFYPMSGEEE